MHNIPPSKKGGEAKDCTILEGNIWPLAGDFSREDLRKKRVFCTSENTNDYCEVQEHCIRDWHQILRTVGLRFTTNLALGLPRSDALGFRNATNL